MKQCGLEYGLNRFLVNDQHLSAYATQVFAQLRRDRFEGKLHQGTAKFEMKWVNGNYTGEVNEIEEACG